MDSQKKFAWTAGAISSVLVLVFSYFVFITPSKNESPNPQPSRLTKSINGEPAPDPPASKKPDPQETQLSPLELVPAASDPQIRQLVQVFSSHPQWQHWFNQQDLIQKFVAAVNNIAQGETPRYHLSFLAPKGDFLVSRKGGITQIDPLSYSRYDPVAEVIQSVDLKRCSDLYRRALPTLERAFKELGHPGTNFDKRMQQAIHILLQTPLVKNPIELRPKIISYEMARPELENLNSAQKHFLRLGPKNMAMIRSKLIEFSQSHGWRIPASR